MLRSVEMEETLKHLPMNATMEIMYRVMGALPVA